MSLKRGITMIKFSFNFEIICILILGYLSILVPLAWKCKFPTWLTFPGHWHTLDYTSTYSFHQKNATLRITNQTGADIKVHCAHTKAASPSGNSIALVAHWQHHWLIILLII